jgi:hypothetical protein
MKKWQINWSTYDCGCEIVEAETEDEAKRKFREIPYTELVEPSPCDYAEIQSVTEVLE